MKSRFGYTSCDAEFLLTLLLVLIISNAVHRDSSVAALQQQQQQQQMVVGKQQTIRIGIIGGGASGMFAACAASDALNDFFSDKNSNTPSSSSSSFVPISITVMEASKNLMTKVKISGGGRCNVMHDDTKATKEILECYPRGRREISGIFNKRFTPSMAREWFESRGVTLKTESDGRMFPITDSSQTIIDTIETAAKSRGLVHIKQGIKIHHVSVLSDGTFMIRYNETVKNKDGSQTSIQQEPVFDALVLATGSYPMGHEIASQLGHSIINPVPSLFTLRMSHDIKPGGLLHDLAGLSVQNARISFKVSTDELNTKHDGNATSVSSSSSSSSNIQKKTNQKKISFANDGPLLITHEGVSGPASLKLSAFAAREFHALNYRGLVQINFAPGIDDIESILMEQKHVSPRKLISSSCPLVQRGIDYDNYDLATDSFHITETKIIPKRLWFNICNRCGISDSMRWGDVSKNSLRSLASWIGCCNLEVTGKSVNKDEFVTAGGIHLKDIDMTSMQSKIVSGLFFCGEVVDVDGVTGGFNFMNCWATGFVAGSNAARKAIQELA